MADTPELETLYQQAQSALKARDYTRAAELLKQILIIDENYKDASRLLARLVKIGRRRWYNDLRIWGPAIGFIVIGLMIWLVPKISPPARLAPTPTSTITASPTVTVTPAIPATPTITASPAPTAIPLAWKRLNTGLILPRDQITRIAIDSRDADVLYIDTENAGLYQTINDGQSWQPAPAWPSEGVIFYDPLQEARIATPQGNEEIYRMAEDGIEVSRDGGTSWVFFKASNISGIIPTNQEYVLVYNNFRLNKVSDAGTTWEFLSTIKLEDFHAMLVSPHNPDVIYIGGEKLVISQDGGHSWEESANGLGAAPLDLFLSPGGNGVMYAKTIHADTNSFSAEKLFLSEDSGNNWKLIEEDYFDLALDADGQTIYRIWCSICDGSNGYMAIMRSSDRGKTWQDVHGLAHILSIDADPRISGRVYCIEANRDAWAEGKLLLSELNDVGYGLFGDGTPPIGFQIQAPEDLIFLPTRDGYPLIFLVSKQFLFLSGNDKPCKSIDHGERFHLAGRINRLFIATTTGVAMSTDGCRTWKNTEQGSSMESVNTLADDPNNPNIIYAGADSGAYVSFNGGENWGQVNDGLLGATVVYSVVVDKDSNVYAATPYGIFKLENK